MSVLYGYRREWRIEAGCFSPEDLDRLDDLLADAFRKFVDDPEVALEWATRSVRTHRTWKVVEEVDRDQAVR